MKLHDQDIFMTGGAGTLGKAIARRRKEKGWTGRLTVYSTDAGKHNAMRSLYPDVNFIQGDIRNLESMTLSMFGHDVVIHAAAVKFIPDSEYASIDTIDVNVYGSEVVCQAARAAGIKTVLGISTDKACHPANAYGSTKHLMEKVFQEHARHGGDTKFILVRYGNVLESRGSVLEAWEKARAEGKPIKMTNPEMTRFWLSPSQAADYVEESFNIDNGMIYVPKMPALSIRKLLEYSLMKAFGSLTWEGTSGIGHEESIRVNGHPYKIIPMRPGEKLHETLITEEETEFSRYFEKDGMHYFLLLPTTRIREPKDDHTPYTSQNAPELTRDELMELLRDE